MIHNSALHFLFSLIIVFALFIHISSFEMICKEGRSKHGGGAPHEDIFCDESCVNVTNLSTMEIEWGCQKCKNGINTCHLTQHLYSCCCDFNFCNYGTQYIPSKAPATTTTTTAMPPSTLSTATTGGEVSSSTSMRSTRLSTTTPTTTTPTTSTTSVPSTTVHRRHDTVSMLCFNGVSIGYHQRLVTGALMQCDGVCTNFTLSIAYVPVTAFICEIAAVCGDFVDNSCMYINSDNSFTFCCCDDHPTCNVGEASFLPSPMPAVNSTDEKNITCYVGFSFMNSLVISENLTIPAGTPIGSYQACSGSCANITLGDFGTLFTCDPISVCIGLNIQNSCSAIYTLLSGCCCAGDRCNLALDWQPSSTPTTKRPATFKALKSSVARFLVMPLFIINVMSTFTYVHMIDNVI